MKKVPLIILTAALAVSLWFHWRNRPPVPNTAQAVSGPVEKPSPVLPVKLEEIDFSGTGLGDDAWQLTPPGGVGDKIPSAWLPAESVDPKPAAGTEGEWNPDVKLKLHDRP